MKLHSEWQCGSERPLISTSAALHLQRYSVLGSLEDLHDIRSTEVSQLTFKNAGLS